jgi:MtrB/PioB family decaheme-associated outer membrane protein
MRALLYVSLACSMALATPAAARAQAGASSSTPPSTPTQPAPAQPTAAGGAGEISRSLFEPTWRQIELSGRFSSISGDPARFQRYEDQRDGIVLTGARHAFEEPNGAWLFRGSADNIGWRDQRYFAEYARPGRFTLAGHWDQIPQFYSVDTRTPYTDSGGTLTLDDATQQAIERGQTTLNAYAPIAGQFDLRERRDIGSVNFTATPSPSVDVTAAFTTQRHLGELPWGASFGFSNDVEVALPYDSRTNDFSLGAEWTNRRSMMRVAYQGSWFDNLDDTLIWDSPLRLNDTTSAPGRGRMALWPSNSANTISAAGSTKFARRTQLTGALSFGWWNNDEPLQPFTINPTLPQLALPRETTDASARVVSANVSVVTRPVKDWRFSGRLRHYGFDNDTGAVPIVDFINYDTSVTDSSTGGPRQHAHSRTSFEGDATWTGLQRIALAAGFSRNQGTYDVRIFEETSEKIFFASADAIGSQWMTFRARYEVGDRNGKDFDETLLLQVGEYPSLRHYDLADRTRHRLTGQVDIVPNELWTFSASTTLGKEDYDESYFGLQESRSRVFAFAADFRHPVGFGAGATYTYERYAGLQRSRSASPGVQQEDPARDWTADSTERVNYFSIYASPPPMGRAEARISYDYAYSHGDYLYGVVPGGPLPPPSQLPRVYNKLQELRTDVRYRLTNKLAATVTYLYEPFRVYDFAFDPSVINGIIQPSSLVLGYVYRPYTAHAARAGVIWFF